MGITGTGSSLGNSTDGYTTPNPEVYNAVADPENHEVDPEGLNPKEVPRHDKYAMENTGEEPERLVPYTATGANPSYQEDRASGIGEPDPDVPAEANELVDVTEPAEVVEVDEAEPDGEAAPAAEAEGDGEVVLEPPAGNASGEEWRAYAISQGMSSEEADSMGRDELRDRYTGS